MGRDRITVIGAGNVGGTAAQRLAEKDCYNVVLLDIIEGLPNGKALDLAQSAPICGYTGELIGTSDYKDTADSSVVVVTSGVPRKHGMSRDELLETNVRIVKSVVERVAEYSTECHSRHRVQSVRCDDLCGVQGEWVSQGTCLGDGGCA